MNKILYSVILLLLVKTATAQYCIPSYTNSCLNNHINQVVSFFGTTNIGTTGTGCGLNNYTYYSSQVVTQQQGSTFNLTGDFVSSVAAGQVYRIWVDWNIDGDFNDPGESPSFSSARVNNFNSSITIPLTSGLGLTRIRIRTNNSGTAIAVTDDCTNLFEGETEDYGLYITSNTPCLGVPNAGTIPLAAQNICNTKTTYLQPTGTSPQNGITFQWQVSTNGGTTWSNIAGATSPSYTVPAGGAPNSLYHMIALCNNSFQKDTTNDVAINIVGPSYTPLPIQENFENWTNYCDTNDIPYNGNYYWENQFSTGNSSWRRNDGVANVWANTGQGLYFPAASIGNHSARYHSSNVATGTGALVLYADCSTPGTKKVEFDFIKPMSQGGIELYYNTGGGDVLFGTVTAVNNSWTTHSFPLPSTSATTQIKFVGTGNSTSRDIGVDNIFVLPDCSGVPVAGDITPIKVCKNKPFKLYLQNNLPASNLTYDWSYFDGFSWVTLFGSPTFSPSINIPIGINQATLFRCDVTCSTSGLTSTTPDYLVTIDTFYKCYCDSSKSNNYNIDDMDIIGVTLSQFSPSISMINNIQDTVLLNSTLIKTQYTNYQSLDTAYSFIRDSSYKYPVSVTCNQEINIFNPVTTSIFIDWNRDGNFDPVTELAASGAHNPISQKLIDTIITPAFAQVGLTGMRVVSRTNLGAATISPCGLYPTGETEDYLVNIELPPCITPPNAGFANTTDTSICANYSIVLTDSTHDKNLFGLSQIWQISSDGLIWNDIVGADKDTLTQIITSLVYYRFKIMCNGTPSYSNVITVNVKPVYACYPPSYAVISSTDSGDLGSFQIGTYSFITGGPHVNNPAATKSRTDNTSATTVLLQEGSNHLMNFYSILKSSSHADAMITLFMDFNNNGLYDIPSERVYKGIAGISNYYLNAIPITIPATGITLNVNTGMRVVLNNDISSSPASDNGVGTYTSGETEDYLVQFRKTVPFPQDIKNIVNLKNVSIYPNPTTSNLYIEIEGKDLRNVKLEVANIVGSIVDTHNTGTINGTYNTFFNVSKYAKGSYILKISTETGYLTKKFVVE